MTQPQQNKPNIKPTLIKMTLVLVTVALAITLILAILLPVLTEARITAMKQRNADNLRTIAQKFAATGGKNHSCWIGFNPRTFDDANKIKIEGKQKPQDPDGSHPSVRLAKGLSKGEFTPDQFISPIENKFNTYDGSAPFSHENSSYAMLHIGYATPNLRLKKPAPPRHIAWRGTNNSHSPMISDRNISPDNTNPRSLWNKPQDKLWQGHVVYADTHVEFHNSAFISRTSYGSFIKKDPLAYKNNKPIPNYTSKTYGPGPNNADNLFTNEDKGKDALLIHKL